MKELALKSKNYVINMDISTYRNYVANYPRDFDVVLFFTASNCGEYCEYAKKNLNKKGLILKF